MGALGGAGNYGNGISMDLLLQLMQNLQGYSAKDASALLGVQGKQTNNLQDLIKSLFDPQMGMMTGTFDPMSTQSQVPQAQPFNGSMPTIESTMQSQDPVLAQLAKGIMSGDFANKIEAKAFMAGQAANYPNMTLEQLYSAVDDMFSEKSKYQQDKATWDMKQQEQVANAKQAASPYAKAGLPDPTEQYAAGFDQQGQWSANLPDAQRMAHLSEMDQGVADAQANYDKVFGSQQNNIEGAFAHQRAGAQAAPQGIQPNQAPAPAHALATPTSETEARAWARQAGVSEQDAVKWFRQAQMRAQDKLPERRHPGDQARWDQQWAANGKQWTAAEWDNILNFNKVHSVGNPMFDKMAGTKQHQQTADQLLRHDGVPQQMAGKPVATPVDPRMKQASLKLMQAKSGQRNAQEYARGQAFALNEQGRTPTSDALQQRLMQILLARQGGM